MTSITYRDQQSAVLPLQDCSCSEQDLIAPCRQRNAFHAGIDLVSQDTRYRVTVLESAALVDPVIGILHRVVAVLASAADPVLDAENGLSRGSCGFDGRVSSA